MRFQLKLIFAFSILCFATNSFSQTLLSFPEDSARWYLQKNTPTKTGCDISFIRYYSKGDTVVGSTKYHKIYRQTSLDSTLFPESKDTLRIFMRMSADSQQVIMRFVDSINGYGISEQVVGDFTFYDIPAKDTFPRYITQNGYKRTQYAEKYKNRFYNSTCKLQFKNGVIPVNLLQMVLLDSVQSTDILKYFNYISIYGESQTSWFAIDLDSAGIYAYHESCEKVMAFTYKMEILFKDTLGNHFWSPTNIDCTTSLKSIASNSTQIKISPNPFLTSFKVQYSETIKSLKLIDTSGKTFLDKNYRSVDLEKTILVETLKPGIYFLIINGEHSKKVLKY